MSLTPPNTRWMTPPPVYDNPSTFSTTPLKPYLELLHILSLAWLAYPILSLLFIAFRLELSSAASQQAVANAKGDLLTSCQAAEQAATAAASMPRYMAATTNQQIADAVNGTMNGARAALVLSLTVMEAIINFIVDIYRSTFLCFVELVVRGGLSLLISAVQDISSFLETTLNGLATSIQNDVASTNSAIQSFVSGINKVNPFGAITAPQFGIPSLTALQNVTIPTDFENTLIALNNSLPTFSEIKDDIDKLLDTPFELLKADINSTFANLTFDPSVLPIPQQNTISFCHQLDTSVVDDLGHDLLQIAKIGLVIIVVCALLLLLGACALEWYKWRCLKQHLRYTREAWASDPTMVHVSGAGAPVVQLTDHNLMLLQADEKHPLLTRIANRLAALLHLSAAQHTNLRWFFAYVFHPPALACFLIGLFGLLSVEIQLAAVHPLADKYSAQAASATTDFTNRIASSINASMYAQSSAYAADVNGRVDNVQSTINDGLFGWVNGTTTTLNDTLNTFYDDVQNMVSTVFNGTILEGPVQEFIKCFIGSKVDALEAALTFLNQNLNVDIPRVNESVLVLSPADVNEASRPIALAAIGGSADGSGSGDGGLVGRLVATYTASLEKERLMFGIFLGLWGLVVLMALAIIFWHSYGAAWVYRFNQRRWQRRHRDGAQAFAQTRGAPADWNGEHGFGFAPGRPSTGSGEKPSGDAFEDFGDSWNSPPPHLELKSFTPLPASPKSFFTRVARGANGGPHIVVADAQRDSAHTFLDAPPPPRKGPAKLLGIGRNAMGKEVLVADEDADAPYAHEQQEQREPQTPAWLRRLTSYWRKDAERDDEESQPQASERQRVRPQLTISTPSGRAGDLPTLEHEHGAAPGSAWSVSPGPTPGPPGRVSWRPPVMPWMQQIMPTKKVSFKAAPPTAPLQPQPAFKSIASTTATRHRRDASVPVDVGDTGSGMYDAPAPAYALPMPLHHGFAAPPPPTPPPVQSPVYLLAPDTYMRALAPPPDRHRRMASARRAAEADDADPFGSPMTEYLATHHARPSSSALDPFVTPFDDEAAVPAHNFAGVGAATRRPPPSPTNPFNPFAVAI